MKRGLASAVCLLVGGALAFGLVGCGPKKVKAQGKLTKGTMALQGKDREKIQVRFTPTDEKKRNNGIVYDATVDQDAGTYEIVVPAGQYRISIVQFDEELTDKFQGAFREGLSPLVRDINADTTIDIDLDKPDS